MITLISGTWKFMDSANSSSRFPDFQKSEGNSVIDLVSSPTKIAGVHYVQVKNFVMSIVAWYFLWKDIHVTLDRGAFEFVVRMYIYFLKFFKLLSSFKSYHFAFSLFWSFLFHGLPVGSYNFPWCIWQRAHCGWCSNQDRRCIYMAI